jgi:hypothetical protein
MPGGIVTSGTNGGKKGSVIELGITRASLNTQSFISEDSSFSKSCSRLKGLKENGGDDTRWYRIQSPLQGSITTFFWKHKKRGGNERYFLTPQRII